MAQAVLAAASLHLLSCDLGLLREGGPLWITEPVLGSQKRARTGAKCPQLPKEPGHSAQSRCSLEWNSKGQKLGWGLACDKCPLCSRHSCPACRGMRPEIQMETRSQLSPTSCPLCSLAAFPPSSAHSQGEAES